MDRLPGRGAQALAPLDYQSFLLPKFLALTTVRATM